jgi:hypothetical protein
MKRRMVSIAAASATVLSVLVAPPAHANPTDENGYLQDVRSRRGGFGGSNAQLLQLGYLACQVMRSSRTDGMSVPQTRSQSDKAVGKAAWNMGLQPNIPGTYAITEAAEDYLWPC